MKKQTIHFKSISLVFNYSMFIILIFILVGNCKNPSNEHRISKDDKALFDTLEKIQAGRESEISKNVKTTLEWMGEIQQARKEALVLNIPLDLLELVDYNGWDWNAIKRNYLSCMNHPLLDFGLDTADINSLCVCIVTTTVNKFQNVQGDLKGSTTEKITEIATSCMHTSGVRQKLDQIAGLLPNQKPINNNIDYRPVEHLYNLNGWSEIIIKPLYATTISNKSLKNDFISIGYSESDYNKYAICLMEKIVVNEKPALAIANPKKFSIIVNDYAVECLDNLSAVGNEHNMPIRDINKLTRILASLEFPFNGTVFKNAFGEPDKIELPDPGDPSPWGQSVSWNVANDDLQVKILLDNYSQMLDYNAKSRFIMIEAISTMEVNLMNDLVLNKTTLGELNVKFPQLIESSNYFLGRKMKIDDLYYFMGFSINGELNKLIICSFDLDQAD